MADLSTKTTWRNMIRRCADPKATGYEYYGGRGITVCERWHDYALFLADMGGRPRGMSIDRIDPSGNYEPGNCRWTNAIQQNNNKRNTVRVEWRGRMLTVAAICRLERVAESMVRQRLYEGWSLDDAIAIPAKELGDYAAPIMDKRLRELPPTDIELAGYMPNASVDYFAVIHPDGTIIYHFGPDGWYRA